MEAHVIPIGSLEDHERRLRQIEKEDVERRLNFEASEQATKKEVRDIGIKLDEKFATLYKVLGTGLCIFLAGLLPYVLQHVG